MDSNDQSGLKGKKHQDPLVMSAPERDKFRQADGYQLFINPDSRSTLTVPRPEQRGPKEELMKSTDENRVCRLRVLPILCSRIPFHLSQSI